ncbi:hypothetical protein ABMA28_010480 [Loxostege sticticalis]|uniref:Serine palmitoyltransferase small subunit B n=1 Tax=Loxostege sticticalis TaxID=481309 RepID=A0ABD0S963_LOXSC
MTTVEKTERKKQNFFSYWYMRYEMATEMYMVEPWEKVVVHALFAVVFLLFWYFNSAIVISGISRLRNTSTHVEEIL